MAKRKFFSALLVSLYVLAPFRAPAAERLNVLLICVDDLRPELGCYGVEPVQSPNLDRLARQGRLFNRHYVQVPTCGASRYAMLTGTRPDSAASYGNGAFALLRNKQTSRETLPGMFRRAGYKTVSIGKVSHSPDGRSFGKNGGGNDAPEMPGSWHKVGVPAGKWKTGWGAFFGYADGSTRVPGKTSSTEAADVSDTGYPDGRIAQAAVEELAALRGAPFFLAVGFYKPHLPFNAPKKYWDLYDAASIERSPWPERPVGLTSDLSLHSSGELLRNYGGHSSRKGLNAEEVRRHRHGYFACVSYVDAQIGKVLSALDELELADSTVVVVWGDHGWHLGDLSLWGKHSPYEWSLRSTLIVRTPKMASPGVASDAIVESVDLMPTLAELCGVTPPDGLEGVSQLAVLANPAAPGLDGALGYWSRSGRRARSLRTDRYRFIRWYNSKSDETVAVELYDHQHDPAETRNIAGQHPELVSRLKKQSQRPPKLLEPRLQSE